VGITAQEKTNPPRTRAQEVPSGITGMRVIIVDSNERRDYEEAMRRKSMERTLQALEKLEQRVAVVSNLERHNFGSPPGTGSAVAERFAG